MNEIKGVNGNDIWFGNTCVLACGDLYQLPPVRQSCIFNPVNDAMARMHGSISIFMDEFLLHELTDIMRQKDDLIFAKTLGRIRTGEWNRMDIELLKSREITTSDPSYPHDSLHIFGFNADVDAHNKRKLNEMQMKKIKFWYVPLMTNMIALVQLMSRNYQHQEAGHKQEGLKLYCVYQ